MAGDWIKVESTTPDKPEVLMISEYLVISPETVLGHLIRFWIWVDYQQQNCNGLSVTKKSIDRITRMQNFADAMINCGWLIENNGNLSIPNFDFHNGNTAKTRATTYKRVKKHRNDNVTVSALQKEDIRVTREEKRRDLNTSTKPKRNIKEKVDILMPDWIPQEPWQAYLEMRKKIRKPATDAAILIAIAKMDKFRQQGIKPEDVLNQSVLNSWTGLFEPSQKKSNGNKPGKFNPSQYINRNYERSDDERIIEGESSNLG